MNRLLIVDGSNLLFQMFFGMPARIVNQEGKAIQGTLGFVGALLKIIRMVEPTHMVVFFDGQHKNERCDLNHEYKANRIDYSLVSQDENPFSQMADVCRALDFLGIKYAETNNCEADDVIAGYTFSLNEQWEIVISSFDSDFFQLITDRVFRAIALSVIPSVIFLFSGIISRSVLLIVSAVIFAPCHITISYKNSI